MAIKISFTSLRIVLFGSLLFLRLLCSFKKGYAYEGGETTASHHLHHSHIVQISSQLPAAVCKPSTKGTHNGGEASLEVVHKHGPCSPLFTSKTQIKPLDNLYDPDTTIPAKPDRGAGGYIVTIGLGTPKKELSLIFDTGSDLTWTQCLPCRPHCYQQREPIFDPSKSSSFVAIMCSSPPSSLPISATSHVSSNPICTYNVDYHDGSHSDGFFAKEKLTLTPADVLANFQFGCGQNNYGTFGDTAGIFGLGPGLRSFVSQTAQIYTKFFSYCLPTHSSTGNLIFGRGDARRSRTVKFTALSIEHGHYSITMQGITMDGKRLEIPVQVLSTPPTVVDSGADITYLPPSAYATMRSVFRSKMSKYPIIPPIEPFDTCYDLSRYKHVLVPKISFFFNGGVEVELDANGILHWLDGTKSCLAFAAKDDANDFTIFGSHQQQKFDVVYDVAGGRLGFGPGGCD